MFRYLFAWLLLAGMLLPWQAQGTPLKRAYTELHKGRWQRAYRIYLKLVQHHASNPALHLLKGNLHYARGQFLQSLQAYQSGLRAMPKKHHVWIHNNIGDAFFRLNKYALAARHYGLALRINPRYERARYNLELALRKLKKQPPKPPQKKQRKQRKPPKPSKRRPPPKKKRKSPPPKDFRLDEYDRFIPYSYIRRHKKKTPTP